MSSELPANKPGVAAVHANRADELEAPLTIDLCGGRRRRRLLLLLLRFPFA